MGQRNIAASSLTGTLIAWSIAVVVMAFVLAWMLLSYVPVHIAFASSGTLFGGIRRWDATPSVIAGMPFSPLLVILGRMRRP